MAPATLTPSSVAADAPATPHNKAAAGLIVGALWVVFGDIGTSPIYALRESFLHGTGMATTPAHVLGVLSVLFWAVTLTVTIKYVTLIMRADNKGEGGVLALATLATHGLNGKGRHVRRAITLLAVVGLALFYGDAIITPAISVMSAVEGLSAVAPAFTPFVVPLALVILVALFMLQSRGTADVGRLFGPVMLLWFVVLGVLGLWQVAKPPAVLYAINPIHAYRLISDQGLGVFWTFGSIVLAVTGAEALYADMGHFGRQPIRMAWLGLVMPGLLLNYFGQGALIISSPDEIHQVFFDLVPQDYIIALVALSTLATVIASQAVITGVFSLTRQAIQLGYLPRMEIKHTSETFRCAGRRLWPGRHRRHAGRCRARHGSGDPGVALGLAACRLGVRPAGRAGPRLLRRQRAEDPRRRLAAAHRGGLHLLHHHHLAGRSPAGRR